MKILSRLIVHCILIVFVALMLLPLYLAVIAASHEGALMMQGNLPFFPGAALLNNLSQILFKGLAATGGEPLWKMMSNSLCMALLIATGKIVFALGSAFALVYFDSHLKKYALHSSLLLDVAC